jgi:ABC-type sugar transport system substrate-binding protein
LNKSRHRVRKAALAGSAIALTVFGISISSSAASVRSSASATTTPASVIAAAKANVLKWSATPGIGITAPLKKTPPKGKTLEYLQCSVPVCAQIGDGMQAAAKALGWKFKREIFDIAQPEALVSLANNAAADPPSYLALTTFPTSLFKSAVAKLKSEHVPIIVGSDSLDKPVGAATDIYGNIASDPSEANAGARKAAWVIADSNGTGQMAHFASSDIATTNAETAALQKGMAKCTGCHLDVVDIPSTQIAAGKVPSIVVSYLQAHPTTQYISFSYGDMTDGLDQALTAAGLLTKVKYVGVTPTLQNLQALQSGTEKGAWLGWPAEVQGWQFADVAARISTGTTVIPDPLLPVQWLTASSIKTPVTLYEPAGYQAKFEKLWHVSK